MLISYLPILVYLIISIGLAVLIVALSETIGKKTHTPVKDLPYECGMVPISDARHRYAVRFYVITMFFLVFDIEAIFLYPWGVIFKPLGLFGLIEMGIFILILVVGLAYVWGKGALEWE
ncbi:MAG: NADH-quinone oxidoreductase subunit A [Deltaproteobacteria bacterium]|nr:NADH-quinone oxidoreductase subunit A [Deltaproteobacteria bacterium]MBW2134648.1 NADH-quinone oxidoreductase subunit A [Deltaproteobacteria bacterium]